MRALVLSGGGSLGAFQAGAILGLAERGVRWDLIVGSSVGALNGAFLAKAPRAEQQHRAVELCALWAGLHTHHVHHPNWFGALAGLVPGLKARPSFRDTAPLRTLVERHLGDGHLQTPCHVNTVEMRTGRVHVARNDQPRFGDWIMASAAIPLVFPPVEIEGSTYIDGSVRRTDAVTHAAIQGATEIDVVLCIPRGLGDWMVAPPRRPITLTTIAAMAFLYALNEATEGDLSDWTRRGFQGRRFPRVNVLAPATLSYVNPITFDPHVTARLMVSGRDTALSQL